MHRVAHGLALARSSLVFAMHLVPMKSLIDCQCSNGGIQDMKHMMTLCGMTEENSGLALTAIEAIDLRGLPRWITALPSQPFSLFWVSVTKNTLALHGQTQCWPLPLIFRGAHSGNDAPRPASSCRHLPPVLWSSRSGSPAQNQWTLAPNVQVSAVCHNSSAQWTRPWVCAAEKESHLAQRYVSG